MILNYWIWWFLIIESNHSWIRWFIISNPMIYSFESEDSQFRIKWFVIFNQMIFNYRNIHHFYCELKNTLFITVRNSTFQWHYSTVLKSVLIFYQTIKSLEIFETATTIWDFLSIYTESAVFLKEFDLLYIEECFLESCLLKNCILKSCLSESCFSKSCLWKSCLSKSSLLKNNFQKNHLKNNCI